MKIHSILGCDDTKVNYGEKRKISANIFSGIWDNFQKN